MKTKTMVKYLFVAATVGILFSSCKKKQDDVTDTDTSAASDNALAEGTYNDVHNIADQAATGSLSSYMGLPNPGQPKDLLSTCANITIDTTNRVLTINFGTTNCLCHDGRNRRGSIIVNYTGHYMDSLSSHQISFSNYFVNDNQIMGTKTVTNQGRNSAGHYVFSIQVNGTIIKANNGGTITWTSTRQREWIIGYTTPFDWSDDVYLITGSASGTNAAGNAFTAQITTALRRQVSCRQFVSGVFTLTPAGRPTRTFDFGNGACDDQATITINGNTYTITLR